MRWPRSVGAVLVLAVGGMLLAAGPAAAAEVHTAAPVTAPMVDKPWWQGPSDHDGSCATAPDVDAPVAGAPGGATPAQQQGNDISMWQTYGFAGMHWWTYNLGMDGSGTIGGSLGGCLPDGTALGASSQTMIANFIFQGAKNIVSLDDMVLRLAYTSDWLGAFDPFIVRAVASLHDSVFSEWSLVALGLLGLYILTKAYKGSLASVATLAGSALIVLASVYLISTEPLYLMHTFEDQIDGATGKLASSITGQTAVTGAGPDGCRVAGTTGCSTPLPSDAMIATVHKTMIYRPWLEGALGDPDSKTAQTYGPQLLAATAMTKAEAATRGTPKFAEIVAAKQADFTTIADKIKAEDPVAYAYLQGQHSETRGSLAMRGIIGSGGASLVILAGSLAMAMAKLMAIFVLMGSMVFLLVAIVRGSFGVEQLDRVVSAAVTALVWSVALPISMLLNDAALNNPKLSPLMSALILVIINALIFLAALAIAPGFSGVLRKKHAKKGWKLLNVAVQAAAGFFGARTGAAPPPHAPQHAATDVTDAEVLDDEAGRHRAPPDDEVDGEDWTREPVEAKTSTTRALPDAPVAPDATETASERDDRTLPDKERSDRDAAREAQQSEPQPGGEEYRPTRTEGTSTVYNIYSGRKAPGDESPVRDDEPVSGEVLSDSEDGSRLAIDSGSSGGPE